jgi:hypothetical protein
MGIGPVPGLRAMGLERPRNEAETRLIADEMEATARLGEDSYSPRREGSERGLEDGGEGDDTGQDEVGVSPQQEEGEEHQVSLLA